MAEAKYDQIECFYAAFIEKGLLFPNSVTAVSAKTILKKLTTYPDDIIVLDLACGEGHLTHSIAQMKQQVIGVDISEKLLARAKQAYPTSLNSRFIHDDAQELQNIGFESIDCLVCNMALMDIPDIKSTFKAAWRVLKNDGFFLISMLHPCFEAPFFVPQSQIEVDDEQFVACRVMNYLDEGHWHSGGTGIRGRVGAHHRTISTYFNGLISAGFQILAVDEPHLPQGDYETIEEQWFSKIPRLLVIEAQKAVFQTTLNLTPQWV